MVDFAGFEAYRPNGEISISSAFPFTSVFKSQVVTSSIKAGAQDATADAEFPQVPISTAPTTFYFPQTLGVYVNTVSMITVEKYPNKFLNIQGVRLRTTSISGTPAIGTFRITTFVNYVLPSNSTFGFQSFDANGKLLFDSETPSMEILRIGKSSDWTYDGSQTVPGGFGYNYVIYYYSMPVPAGTEGVAEIQTVQYSGEMFPDSAYGCRSAFNRLTFKVMFRSDFPGSPTLLPRVMFIRKTA